MTPSDQYIAVHEARQCAQQSVAVVSPPLAAPLAWRFLARSCCDPRRPRLSGERVIGMVDDVASAHDDAASAREIPALSLPQLAAAAGPATPTVPPTTCLTIDLGVWPGSCCQHIIFQRQVHNYYH